MALTPEKIDRLIRQAGGLPPKEGGIYRALVKLTEAEGRKEYTELIQRMRDALEHAEAWGEELKPAPAWVADAQSAIAAANARLEGKP